MYLLGTDAKRALQSIIYVYIRHDVLGRFRHFQMPCRDLGLQLPKVNWNLVLIVEILGVTTVEFLLQQLLQNERTKHAQFQHSTPLTSKHS